MIEYGNFINRWPNAEQRKPDPVEKYGFDGYYISGY